MLATSAISTRTRQSQRQPRPCKRAGALGSANGGTSIGSATSLRREAYPERAGGLMVSVGEDLADRDGLDACRDGPGNQAELGLCPRPHL